MPHGGRRINSGRKTTWVSGLKAADTTLIRIPRSIRDKLLEVAHRIDSGEAIALSSDVDKLVLKIADLEEKLASQLELFPNKLGDRNASVEYCTPPKYVEMARAVMGGIDLDPASNVVAQAWIKATQYYTKEDDGLKQNWSGRIWCNPPYGSPEVRLFAQMFLRKAIALYSNNEIESAIFLLNRTGAKWYKDCVLGCSAICEVNQRIAFLDANKVKASSPRHHNDFLYLGKDVEKFKSVFTEVGYVRAI